MNQELLDALDAIYEIVACAYDETCDNSQIVDREAHEKLGDQLGLMFEFIIQSERYLTVIGDEADLLKLRNK